MKDQKPAVVVAPTETVDRLAILEERIAAVEATLPPAGWVVPVVVFAERPTVVATRMSGGVWSISNGGGEQSNGRTLEEAIAALPPGVLTGSPPLRRW